MGILLLTVQAQYRCAGVIHSLTSTLAFADAAPARGGPNVTLS